MNKFKNGAAAAGNYAKDCGGILKEWANTREVKESVVGGTIGFALGEAMLGIPTFGAITGLVIPHLLKRKEK